MTSILRPITRPILQPILRSPLEPGVGKPYKSIVTEGGRLAPFVTFTRASTGTYFDSAGVMQTAAANAPRYDYNPSTLALRGLLIEEARTNLVLNSAVLVTQSVAVTAAAHTLTFYGTGTVTLSGVSTAGPLVGTGANDRVSLTFTPTAGSLTLTVSGSVTLAQLELGAFATSYIPTTGATATRAADLATITDLSLIGWNATEGTLFLDATPLTGTTSLDMVTAHNTLAESLAIYGDASPVGWCRDGGVTQCTVGGAASGRRKAAFGFKANDFALSVDGAAPTTDTSGTMPTPTRLDIGTGTVSISSANRGFHLRRLRYYPRRLTNAKLQAITA